MEPKRVVLYCIDNEEYNGAYAEKLFYVKHNLNFLALYVDRRASPGETSPASLHRCCNIVADWWGGGNCTFERQNGHLFIC